LNFRGNVTLVLEGLGLILADVVQRVVISSAVRLFPSRRHRILAWWQQLMALMVLGIVRTVGGARIGHIPQIPGGSGVLVLMNHQSLMDIPLVVRAVRPGYPRIVTRARYAKGKPLISHMLKLYQYPLVEPRATTRADLEDLGREAAASPVPMVIYPEGTRTRNGGIGAFRKSGLRTILAARDWEVWLATADGFWECAKLEHFRSSVSSIRGSMRVDGPFPGPGPEASVEEIDAFIDSMQEKMGGYLAELRAGSPDAA
jgi:1-acyl-sn-glycerol-3-phosphate acyltransferase